MTVTPQKEHDWLQQMVGEWTYEHEAVMGPDQPPHKATGEESARTLGGVWVLSEGRGLMPDGNPAITQMMLGYDPTKKRFVGTFIGSMMTFMWVYDGELEADGKTLSLYCDGPSFTEEGKMAPYKDVITIVSPDHRMLTSHTKGPNGEWVRFMTANYYRKS